MAYKIYARAVSGTASSCGRKVKLFGGEPMILGLDREIAALAADARGGAVDPPGSGNVGGGAARADQVSVEGEELVVLQNARSRREQTDLDPFAPGKGDFRRELLPGCRFTETRRSEFRELTRDIHVSYSEPKHVVEARSLDSAVHKLHVIRASAGESSQGRTA